MRKYSCTLPPPTPTAPHACREQFFIVSFCLLLLLVFFTLFWCFSMNFDCSMLAFCSDVVACLQLSWCVLFNIGAFRDTCSFHCWSGIFDSSNSFLLCQFLFFIFIFKFCFCTVVLIFSSYLYCSILAFCTDVVACTQLSWCYSTLVLFSDTWRCELWSLF